MATIALTTESFAETVDADGIVIIDWWAAWCGPCRNFAPVFEEASERHAGVTFAKVDTEANQSLSAQAGITSIPTVMAFRDGILLYNQAGVLPAAGLDELVAKVAGLDMDEVRSAVAAEAS